MVVKGNTFPDRKTTTTPTPAPRTPWTTELTKGSYTVPALNTGTVLDTVEDVVAVRTVHDTPLNGCVVKTEYSWKEYSLSLGLLQVHRDPQNTRNHLLSLYLMEDNTAVLKTHDGTYCAHMVFAPSEDPTKFPDVGIATRYRSGLHCTLVRFATGLFHDAVNSLRVVGNTQTRIPVIPTNIWADIMTQLSIFMAEGGLNT